METRLHSLIVAASALSLLTIGCTRSPAVPTPSPSLNVPAPRSVEIKCYHDDKQLLPKTFVLDESQANQVAKRLDNLKWRSETSRLAEIKLIHPDVSIHLTDTSGGQHIFQFYWKDDSFLDQQQGLLLASTDLSGLRRDVAAITGLASTPVPD